MTAPPPISATDALTLCDQMIEIMGLWRNSHGKLGNAMQTMAVWMQQIRPHLAEAAARSNEKAP